MASLAPCSETEEAKESKVDPGPAETFSRPEDVDGPAEKEPGPQGEESHGKEDVRGEENGSTTEEDKSNRESRTMEPRSLRKMNSWKTVRFQDPSETEASAERDSSSDSLFPDAEMEEWTSTCFEELFMAKDWEDISDDRLLRKRVLKRGPPQAPCPTWGQEVTVKMEGVLEDRSVVEKDCKLVFVIGERDVTQALEECALSMQKEEITLLLADSQYAYGLLGRDPDIPAWTPLLYQVQLLDLQDKPDPLTLAVADRIRIGNQKRERGNFHFQREEFNMAARAYSMALEVLTTRSRDGGTDGEVLEEEVHDYRIKCLNNLATAHLKLEQLDEALHTSQDVLVLEPDNVKALYRAGKLLSDRGEYKEAMEKLKKALKLEPATKAIHVELSKLVRRQSGGREIQEWKSKPAEILGESVAPFLVPSKKKPPGISWKFLLGALVVALGSLVTSVVLTARN